MYLGPRKWLHVLSLLLLPLFASVLSGCHNKPTTLRADAPSNAVAAGACNEGGASYDIASGQCVCDSKGVWNGSHCEDAKSAPPKAEPKDEKINSDGTHESAGIDLSEKSEPSEKSETPDATTKDAASAAATALAKSSNSDRKALAKRCHRARGKWLAKENFCDCPYGKVLIGGICHKLPGHVTDDVCLRALHKGRWQHGRCECSDDLVFAPGRGGCVAPLVAQSGKVARLTCESTLNNGHWDRMGGTCTCPAGKIWINELCQIKQQFNSREICESSYNKGHWDFSTKLCQCPSDKLWINQACSLKKSVTMAIACASEHGGGTWNAESQRCICPRLGHWDPVSLACHE